MKETRKPLSLRVSLCFQGFDSFWCPFKYARYVHICALCAKVKTQFYRRICRRFSARALDDAAVVGRQLGLGAGAVLVEQKCLGKLGEKLRGGDAKM